MLKHQGITVQPLDCLEVYFVPYKSLDIKKYMMRINDLPKNFHFNEGHI